jgi:hypothetical protein
MAETVKVVQVVVKLESKSVEIRAFKAGDADPGLDSPDFDQDDSNLSTKDIKALLKQVTDRFVAAFQNGDESFDICVNKNKKIVVCKP